MRRGYVAQALVKRNAHGGRQVQAADGAANGDVIAGIRKAAVNGFGQSPGLRSEDQIQPRPMRHAVVNVQAGFREKANLARCRGDLTQKLLKIGPDG